MTLPTLWPISSVQCSSVVEQPSHHLTKEGSKVICPGWGPNSKCLWKNVQPRPGIQGPLAYNVEILPIIIRCEHHYTEYSTIPVILAVASITELFSNDLCHYKKCTDLLFKINPKNLMKFRTYPCAKCW